MKKKFDSNSLIGFALIAIILGIYIFWFSPQPQNENIDTTKVTSLPTQAVVHNPPFDSIGKPTTTTSSKLVYLQNDKLKLTFTTQGAMFSQAELLAYDAWNFEQKNHARALYLIDNQNALLDLAFIENGKQIHTKDLVFNVEQSETQLNFSTQTPAGGKLSFIYTLRKDYIVDFSISSHGITLADAPTLTFDLAAIAQEKGRSVEERYTDFHYAFDQIKDIDYETSETLENKVDWIAHKGQFFSLILDTQEPFQTAEMKLTALTDSLHLKKFETKATFSKADLQKRMQWYLGPNNYKELAQYNREYETIVPLGWTIIGWINKWFFIPMFNLLRSWGISGGVVILLMTIIVKLITSPIMYKQYKQGAMMRVLKPELQEITEKYKDKDAMKKQQATMDLYRKAGVNPMAGCIPALLQMPIFLALFNLFPNLITLRGESFLWAEDLTAFDSVFELPFNIPMYGSHISLFTLLYAATMFLYTKLNAGGMEQPTQEGMPNMKFIMYLMPFMLLVWINNYASGLSWYYFVSNTISIILVLVIKKFFIDEDKIHAQLQENKKKPKKKGKLQHLLEQAQAQQKKASK